MRALEAHCGWLLLALCAVLCGCPQEQRYVVEARAIALTVETPPFFVDEDDDAVFLVQERFEFPITPPPENFNFNAGVDDPAPFPRGPWVFDRDVTYELDWTLSNASDQRVELGLVLDGFNEFHEYAPGPEDFHQYEERHALAPGERVSGTVRDLELAEVGIDLATVVNGAPNSNQIVFEGNNSRTDPRSQQFVPDVIPGLVGLRVGILATEAVDAVLEVSIRAIDHGRRIAARGEDSWDLPEPELFTPIVPEA